MPIFKICNFIFSNNNKEKINNNSDNIKALLKFKNLKILRTKLFFLKPKYIEAKLAKRLKKINWIEAKKETKEIKKFISVYDVIAKLTLKK